MKAPVPVWRRASIAVHSTFTLLGLCLSTAASSATPLEDWLSFQASVATQRLIDSTSVPDGARGSVIASPSRKDPDYYYHWVRDGALVMQAILDLYQDSLSTSDQALFRQRLLDYIDFSRGNQLTRTLSPGLGEPKFYVTGAAFDGPWGRPQNDGPALRALILSRFALLLLEEGKEGFVRRKLYSAEVPAQTVIKADLEFISHHWRETNFDLWEEIKGTHFYTRMVMKAALREGSALALRLGDPAAAGWYLRQAAAIETELARHWDNARGYIVSTLDRDDGIDYKESGLDSSVVLAVLHAYDPSGNFSATDDRVLATVSRLAAEYARRYPINSSISAGLAPAIGRYPEDRYDGYSSGCEGSQGCRENSIGRGNPWVLLTAAFAEFHYKVIQEWRARRGLNITWRNIDFIRSLGVLPERELVPGTRIPEDDPRFDRLMEGNKRSAEKYLARVRTHTNPDGSLSEQINKHSGYMQGAPHLTWNYAALVTMLRERKAAMR